MTALPPVLQRLRDAVARLPQVEALVLSGSRARREVPADPHADIDLYVFTRADIPLAQRERLVAQAGGGHAIEMDQRFWGLSDHWIDPDSGLALDVNHFDAGWMADMIDRVLLRHEPSMGYSTCFWHTVRQAQVLFDRDGWFRDLQQRAQADYPEPLRRAIVALNHPVLRGIGTSYLAQIDKAVARQDPVSLNHRLAALLASYFDCVFAADRVPHPGEKRLLELAAVLCPHAPDGMAEDVRGMLHAACTAPDTLVPRLHGLLDRLDEALRAHGLLPPGAA